MRDLLRFRGNRTLPPVVSLTILAAMVLTGCASTGDSASSQDVTDRPAASAPAGPAASSSTAASSVQGEVVVSAAASLTDAIGDVEVGFEAANPDADVILNLGGSSALREQILAGAPVDVFASANLSNMDQVVVQDLTSSAPQVFTTNLLQIAVPHGNPAGVTGLEDLSDDNLLVGLCAEGVPCGDFARQVLDNAGVTAVIATNEPDVRALLTKVAADELDAGITYVTDVASTNGEVEGVDIPADVNVVAEYPVATLLEAPNPGGAEAFVAWVMSDAGQSILANHGFTSP